MARDRKVERGAAIVLQPGKRGEHGGALQIEKHTVDRVLQAIKTLTASQLSTGGALQHTHQNAGSHAVTGYIRDETGPAVQRFHHVDQIASDLPARERHAMKLEAADAARNPWNELPMNISRQFDFRVQAAIPRALRPNDV